MGAHLKNQATTLVAIAWQTLANNRYLHPELKPDDKAR
jgi:hypothetical protein